MEANDVVTLIVAVWGAFLATYQWWVSRRERRMTLKVWTYWTSTFVVRLQNVSSRPVHIAEIDLRGRFMSERLQKVFRLKDEEFEITYPATEEGTPLILQPQESYTQSFDCWDQLQQYEIERLRDRADGGAPTLAIRSLVLRIVDGEGEAHEGGPYDLERQPAPRHSDDGYVFATQVRMPAAYGLRRTPAAIRTVARLLGRGEDRSHPDAELSLGREGLAAILASDDDQVLCSELCDSICQREGFSINTVPSHERLVVTVCTALRIIVEGGFASFFGNDFPGLRGYADFPEAFNDIGSEEAASSIADALSLFPEGEPQPDLEQRRSFIAQELSADFGRLERAIRDDSRVHTERLAAYIRTNAHRFLRQSQD